MEAIAELLYKASSSPALERELLDLLSQLEYVGCRKILKGVPFHAVTAEVLRHVAEEASHAYLLKAAAERLGSSERPSERPWQRSWADSPMGALGWEYFSRLDERISAETEAATLNYPAVSWAVERRVLMVYPLYLEITRDEGVKQALARILAQEKRHGKELSRVEFPLGLHEKMIAIESELWSELVTGLLGLMSRMEGGVSDAFSSHDAQTSVLPLQ
jgi:hypothetical protein